MCLRNNYGKNIRSRTESSLGDYNYSLINDDPIKKSRGNENKRVVTHVTGATLDTCY